MTEKMMSDSLVIFAILFWVAIPLFWIPVHFATNFFRKLGFFTYVMPFMTWLPLAYLIYRNRDFFLHPEIPLPVVLRLAGTLLLVLGVLLHIWTGKMLGVRGIMGMPEISRQVHEDLVTTGPFSMVRHPTYLAHTLMFSGVFLITGVVSVGTVALVDFAVVNTIIIPLEEKELLDRFGGVYEDYRKRVPSKFFPFMHRRTE
jgi:protein-S-isoprenylcysteine O-methyltransferase Ste14